MWERRIDTFTSSSLNKWTKTHGYCPIPPLCALAPLSNKTPCPLIFYVSHHNSQLGRCCMPLPFWLLHKSCEALPSHLHRFSQQSFFQRGLSTASYQNVPPGGARSPPHGLRNPHTPANTVSTVSISNTWQFSVTFAHTLQIQLPSLLPLLPVAFTLSLKDSGQNWDLHLWSKPELQAKAN